MALEVFSLAQELLERAGALKGGPPTPLELLLQYLGEHGLGLHYYDPKQAPTPIKSVASAVDEAWYPTGRAPCSLSTRTGPRLAPVLASSTA